MNGKKFLKQGARLAMALFCLAGGSILAGGPKKDIDLAHFPGFLPPREDVPVKDGARPSGQARIIGGTKASSGAYPFMVALVKTGVADNYDAQFCGGTLVHPFWIVTAAHCVEGLHPGALQVLVGATDLSTGEGTRYAVAEIVPHPTYNPLLNDHDIALLRLATPVPGAVPPAPIIDDPSLANPGVQALIMGWGASNAAETQFPEELQEAVVPIVSEATAIQSPQYTSANITDNMLPAGYTLGGIDSCGGDSGGPLLVPGPPGVPHMLAGIVSFGLGDCAGAGVYGIYTRVSRYRNWLLSHLSPGYAAWELREGVQGEGNDLDDDNQTHFHEFAFDLSAASGPEDEIRDSGTESVGADRHALIVFHRPTQDDGTRYHLHVGTQPDRMTNMVDVASLDRSEEPLAETPERTRVTLSSPDPLGQPASANFFSLSAEPGTGLVIAPRALTVPGRAEHSLTPEDPTLPDTSAIYKEYQLTGAIPTSPFSLTLRSADFDARLRVIHGDTRAVIADSNNNNATGSDETLTLQAAAGVDYRVIVTSATPGQTGAFVLGAYQLNTSLLTLASPSSRSASLAGTDPVDPFFPGVVYRKDDYRLDLNGSTAELDIRMESMSLDSQLYVLNAETGQVAGQDDDSGGNLNARLFFTPSPGVAYLVRATSAVQQQTGSYNISVRNKAPLPTLSIPSVANGQLQTTDLIDPNFVGTYYYDDYTLSKGGAAGVSLTMTGSGFAPYLYVLNAADNSIIFEQGYAGGSPASLNFTLEPGINYLIRASSSAQNAVGQYSLQTTGIPALPKLASPTLTSGILNLASPRDPSYQSIYYIADFDLINTFPGQSITATASSSGFDTFLYLLDASNRSVLLENDDFSGTNSRINFTVQAGKKYVIRVSTAFPQETGLFNLQLN